MTEKLTDSETALNAKSSFINDIVGIATHAHDAAVALAEQQAASDAAIRANTAHFA